MKKSNRIIGLCLALLIGAAAMLSVGCTEKTDAESGVSEAVSETASGPLVPSLGEADYSGKVLRMLVPDEDIPFCMEQFGLSENEAEPVSEAVNQRNALLQREYGFTVEYQLVEPFAPFMDRIRNDYMTGTVSYDVAATGLQSLAMLAADGYFLDLLSIKDSHIDLNAEWWDRSSNEDMTILGKLYFATGDILLLDDEYTRCVFYNKDLIRDNGLDDPAQLVYDKQWTLDRMYAMAREAATERDDGQMDVSGNDIWGIVSACFDTFSLVMGCDAPQTEKDENDIPVLSMQKERNMNVFMDVYDIMNDKSCTAYIEQYYRWNDPDAYKVLQQFYDGKSLFMLNILNAVNGAKMRDANIRYGILPMPMYNEEQGSYATTIDPYRFSCVSIMANCEDTDFVTFALEAMAYTSRQYVTPEYWERTLKNKRFLDDDDSPEMLDILFSNRMVELSIAFNWDDCIQYYNNLNFSSSPEVASYVETHRSAFEMARDLTVKQFLGGD